MPVESRARQEVAFGCTRNMNTSPLNRFPFISLTTKPLSPSKLFFYDRDIEVLGSLKGDKNLIRKTPIELPKRKFLEPDAIFMLDTPKGKKLSCMEHENEDYTMKSYQKIEKHVHALNMKSPSKKYKHNKAHRTLFIYRNPSTMKSIMEKVLENISGIGNWFLFKTYDEVCTPVEFKKPTSQSQSPETSSPADGQ